MITIIIVFNVFALLSTDNMFLPLQQLWGRFGWGKLLYITWPVWRGRCIRRPCRTEEFTYA